MIIEVKVIEILIYINISPIRKMCVISLSIYVGRVSRLAHTW